MLLSFEGLPGFPVASCRARARVCCFNLKPQGCVCSMAELSTKVKTSHRLRRIPQVSSVFCRAAGVLSERGLVIYLLFIYLFLCLGLDQKSLLSKGS